MFCPWGWQVGAVAYGFQGADEDAEKLGLTDQLLDAALCELVVVSRGRPCIITGDFNVEPTKILCLLKGFSAGLQVDLEAYALVVHDVTLSLCVLWTVLPRGGGMEGG